MLDELGKSEIRKFGPFEMSVTWTRDFTAGKAYRIEMHAKLEGNDRYKLAKSIDAFITRWLNENESPYANRHAQYANISEITFGGGATLEGKWFTYSSELAVKALDELPNEILLFRLAYNEN